MVNRNIKPVWFEKAFPDLYIYARQFSKYCPDQEGNVNNYLVNALDTNSGESDGFLCYLGRLRLKDKTSQDETAQEQIHRSLEQGLPKLLGFWGGLMPIWTRLKAGVRKNDVVQVQAKSMQNCGDTQISGEEYNLHFLA